MPTLDQANEVNADGEPLFKTHKFLGFEVWGRPPSSTTRSEEDGTELVVTKPKKISMDPLVTHDGAMQMKALAEREGWTDVTVNELIKAKK